jgi:hypothetical protein
MGARGGGQSAVAGGAEADVVEQAAVQHTMVHGRLEAATPPMVHGRRPRSAPVSESIPLYS